MDNEHIDDESACPQHGDNSVSPLANFWLRPVALIIDAILLGIVGAIVMAIAEDFLYSIGVYSRLVGLAIIAVYFGFLQSDLAQGQTLGQHFLHIKVVDRDGKQIPLMRSVCRSIIFWLPVAVSGLPIPLSLAVSPIMIIPWIVIICFVLSFWYFYIFNRNTRQSTNDLLCGTYVVREEHTGAVQPSLRPTARVHYWVFPAICL
ncbi:MAG TPA: RDD family protein, partial [Armatimonadota bacterium]|nr:RDD family protein [Armatimonadota bacterium]